MQDYGKMATGCGTGQEIDDQYEKDKLNVSKKIDQRNASKWNLSNIISPFLS